jgi:hypothetical protein
VVDRRNQGSSETRTVATVPGTLSDYVKGSSGSGEVGVQLSCTSKTGTFVQSGG